MARMGPRRKHYALAVLLITALPSIASAQGALYRYFSAGHYLTKTVDSTLNYDLNKTTVKAWTDSLYSITDTVTFHAYYSFGDDTANVIETLASLGGKIG